LKGTKEIYKLEKMMLTILKFFFKIIIKIMNLYQGKPLLFVKKLAIKKLFSYNANEKSHNAFYSILY